MASARYHWKWLSSCKACLLRPKPYEVPSVAPSGECCHGSAHPERGRGEGSLDEDEGAERQASGEGDE